MSTKFTRNEIAGQARRAKRRGRRALRKAASGIKQVPGPSTNPATNLLIADIGMRGVSLLFRRSLEKGLLRARFNADQAHKIVEGRSLGTTVVSALVSRVATRSLPGFLVVTGGLLAKSVFDRSFKRGDAEREGEKDLMEQAANAPKRDGTFHP